MSSVPIAANKRLIILKIRPSISCMVEYVLIDVKRGEFNATGKKPRATIGFVNSSRMFV
jgi:hypothetical protein